ncbi:AraC family transcriptional regulator [Sphingobacterium phlebotomi]|uniref:AraC family transcriptional regulator n=1 Tax=Sphingobacterium phlebotomi TaxID=2605433 RepID=A0A5D4GV58_9SPHI|nr:helix-turn-helix domain-containing protein [Sphingobacterium phlebotomi]TYR31793.1 AraC family transcriptional regulator [Sphingobacterium phlebotomi]
MVEEIAKVYFQDVFHPQVKKQIFDGLLVFQLGKDDLESKVKKKPIRTDYFGLCLIRKGSARLMMNFKEYQVQDNTLLFLSPMLALQLLDYSDDIEILTLFTGGDFFQEIGLPLYKTYATETLRNDFCNFTVLEEQDAMRFEAYIKNIDQKNTLEKSSLFQRDIIKMTLMLLFYEISDLIHGGSDYSFSDSEVKSKIVMDFFGLASRQFKKERSVQFYADHLYISRKHLSRVVKEITGFGPKAILDEFVVAEAVMLLHISNKTIKDVMYELNFFDSGTFSKFFKSRFGKSPQIYRLEMRAHGQ